MHQIGQRRRQGFWWVWLLLGQQLFGHFIFHKNMHYDYFMKHAPRTLAVRTQDAGPGMPRPGVLSLLGIYSSCPAFESCVRAVCVCVRVSQCLCVCVLAQSPINRHRCVSPVLVVGLSALWLTASSASNVVAQTKGCHIHGLWGSQFHGP